MVNFADVEEPHRLPLLLDSLDVQIQFKGPDVLGGFAEIAASGWQPFVLKPIFE